MKPRPNETAEYKPLDPGLDGWRPQFSNREFYARIDREVIREINELRMAMAKFDSYRHAWAEIVANNATPGRSSEFRLVAHGFDVLLKKKTPRHDQRPADEHERGNVEDVEPCVVAGKAGHVEGVTGVLGGVVVHRDVGQ